MDIVSFLQQQIDGLSRQIEQLNERKGKLYEDLWDLQFASDSSIQATLDKYNLTRRKGQVQ